MINPGLLMQKISTSDQPIIELGVTHIHIHIGGTDWEDDVSTSLKEEIVQDFSKSRVMLFQY
jgi:hypothetical protein